MNKSCNADLLLDPASLSGMVIADHMGTRADAAACGALMRAQDQLIAEVASDELASLQAVLVSQVRPLNAMFADFSARAVKARDVDGDEELFATYAELCLKAQAQCQAAVATIADLARATIRQPEAPIPSPAASD